MGDRWVTCGLNIVTYGYQMNHGVSYEWIMGWVMNAAWDGLWMDHGMDYEWTIYGCQLSHKWITYESQNTLYNQPVTYISKRSHRFYFSPSNSKIAPQWTENTLQINLIFESFYDFAPQFLHPRRSPKWGAKIELRLFRITEHHPSWDFPNSRLRWRSLREKNTIKTFRVKCLCSDFSQHVSEKKLRG